jgi:hypothetical protein
VKRNFFILNLKKKKEVKRKRGKKSHRVLATLVVSLLLLETISSLALG